MATRNTNQTPTPTPAAGPAEPAPAAPLPTHGGVYEFDENTKTLRALEGGPPEDKPAPAQAQTPSATTGEQA